MCSLPGRIRCGPYKLLCLVAAPSHRAAAGPHEMRPLQIAVLCPEVRGAVESTPMKPLELVKQYHEQTKHEFNRYARALGYMDWANQPDPFRRYEGTPLYELPLLAASDEPRRPFLRIALCLTAGSAPALDPEQSFPVFRVWPLHHGMERIRGQSLGVTKQSFQWQSASYGRLSADQGNRRSSSEAGALSLCFQRTRVGAPGAWFE